MCKAGGYVYRVLFYVSELEHTPFMMSIHLLILVFTGMLTDPVYEGKSMNAMIEMVRNGEFPEGSKVLYAHLGGVPALSAYSETFKNG